MKRLYQWLFNCIAVLAITTFLASTALWARSYVGVGGVWVCNVRGATYRFALSRGTLTVAATLGLHSASTLGSALDDLYVTWQGGVVGNKRFVAVMIPLFVLMTGSLVPAIICMVVWRRRPRLPGHCPTCGYDLRATPDRCPECGEIPAKTKPVSVLSTPI